MWDRGILTKIILLIIGESESENVNKAIREFIELCLGRYYRYITGYEHASGVCEIAQQYS